MSKFSFSQCHWLVSGVIAEFTSHKHLFFFSVSEVTIAQLASFMPSDKEAVCSHDGTVRFLLEYKCIAYDLNLIPGEENKCR